MTTNKNSTAADTTTASASTEPRRAIDARIVQNFYVVWLDERTDPDNDDNCRNYIAKLRQVVNTVKTFTDVDECIDSITDYKEEKVFMIISEEFDETISSIVQDISQISFVYIFCRKNVLYSKRSQHWPKIKGIYTDITPIFEALKQDAQNCDQNLVSVSFIKMPDESSNQNLDQLDHSFMYTQILKEILLTIDFDQEQFNEFLDYCREQLIGNSTELKKVDKIEKEYHDHQPIWWYTCNCFLYSMLNRALRLMEVDVIIKMGFFIRDLHNQIAALHSKQYIAETHYNSFIVYRGQGLSQIDLEQVAKTKGGLLSFNNFLSTSRDRAVSLAFAESNQYNPHLTSVLFEITINPSISSSPFGNIRNASHYQAEEEIIFSMHFVFRIGSVIPIDEYNRLWQVDLILTSDNDPQLQVLTRCIEEETERPTGWDRLGQLMIILGKFDKAQELYRTMLKRTTNESERAHLYHMLGFAKNNQGKYVEAISFYEKALEIYQKTLPANHLQLASSYNNIGLVYDNIGEYSKALSYYEKALEIHQKCLSTNHHHLSTCHSNSGGVYLNMSEYSKALYSYEKALEIQQKSLPANHPDLATCYNNIATVYGNIGEYSQASSHLEKAVEIQQKTLPANHPRLITSYNNIGSLYGYIGEYSKALSSFEKVLEIQEKILPADHLSLATSYNNIGFVYYNINEHSKALSYFEKALEIFQKALPPNHSDLATSYNNIGSVYENIGEYLKALSYYEKDLEIVQKSLPPNHPNLATSYNNIGSLYYNMGYYSKAVSYLERALDTWECSLPPNHPNLQTVRESIEIVRKEW